MFNHIMTFIQQFDLTQWVAAMGYLGLFIIVFAESGIFFAFFLPGDSLVFTAGLLASKHVFHLWILVPLLTLTAVAGYGFGYWFGSTLGHWLMKRRESFWFKKRYVMEAHKFYERHGGKALVLGRLVPIVRTFVPIVAGMAEMDKRYFMLFTVIGSVIWGTGITLIGYWIGGIFPNAAHYILLVVIAIVFVSALPAIFHYLKSRFSQPK